VIGSVGKSADTNGHRQPPGGYIVNRISITASFGTILAASLLAGAAMADNPAPSVTLAPALVKTVESRYGANEVPALRAQIMDSITTALKGAGGKCNLSIEIVLEKVAPSHPTVKQQLDDPSQDAFRTRFAYGGAALTGYLRGSGQEPVIVKHERFADDLRFAAYGKDPWSDARLAIDQFSDKLVSACARQN
jgi:hypothetical protein